jgi:RHS repeat-associated protein
VYNVVGDRIMIADPAGEVTLIEYDALARKTRLVDPAAGTFLYDYDANGNVIRQQGPTGVFEMQYNPASQLVHKSLPDGQEVGFEYGTTDENAVGRLTRVVDSAGTLELKYDRRGNVRERRRGFEGNEYVTGYSLDSMNRIRRITYPDGYAVEYAYNSGSLVDSIVDNGGQPVVSAIDYNALGEISGIHFANGVTSSYTFDAVGLMRTIDTLNPRGRALQGLTMEYDDARNVRSITDRRRQQNNQSFEYDELDRIVHATGSYGDEQYQYDEIGNFVRKANLVFARDGQHLQQVSCAIDLELASRQTNGLGSDPRFLACLDTLLDQDSGLSDADRASVQRIRDRARSGGDRLGQSLALEYDDAGNLVERGDRHFEFDAENRLVRVNQDQKSPAVERNLYDAAGERILRTTGAEQTLYIDGIYEEQRPSQGGRSSRRHVRLGNSIIATIVSPLAKVDLITETPDGLLEVCSGAQPAAPAVIQSGIGLGNNPTLGYVLAMLLGFIVLVALRRHRRRALLGAYSILSGVARQLRRRPQMAVFSILLIVAQLFQTANLYAAQDNGANAAANGQAGEKRYYYHLDHLGNTNVITDEKGSDVQRLDYRPFGEQQARTGPHDLEISFNGHEFDREAELYYFGARHYDPLLGRFITPDSIIPEDSPQALHRYVFNANNPIRFKDVTGHDFWDILESVFVVVVAIAVVIAFAVAIVVTAGAATPLVAFAVGVLAGAMIGASIALAVGFILYKLGEISFGDLPDLVLAGAIIGAAVGGLVAVAWAGGFAAGASKISIITAQTALGAATGTTGGATAALVNGASTEAFLGAVLAGAVSGAVAGFISGATAAFLPGVLEFLKAPNFVTNLVRAPVLSTFKGKLFFALGIAKTFGQGYMEASEAEEFDDPVSEFLRKPKEYYDITMISLGIAGGIGVTIACAHAGFGGCIDAALSTGPPLF